MAEETIIRVKRDGKITFKDNNAAHSYVVAYEAGDFNLTVPGPTVNLFLDRGRITSPPSIRHGDDQPMTWSFTANLRDVTDSTVATLNDIIFQTGYIGSTWVSTMGATGEVFTLTTEFFIEGTDHGGTDATITFPYCWVTGSVAEGDPTTLSLSGTSYALYPTLS